jgi:hypothetical protein
MTNEKTDEKKREETFCQKLAELIYKIKLEPLGW